MSNKRIFVRKREGYNKEELQASESSDDDISLDDLSFDDL